MKQAALSRLPLATLPVSYRSGDHYCPYEIWQQQAQQLLGSKLAGLIQQDLPLLSELGLERMDEAQKAELASRYRPYQSTAEGAELLGWLSGEDQFDPACLTD